MKITRKTKNTRKTACLYVVATPIGNLSDITQRALQTLKEVDLIAAEDTRHSKKLLGALGIHTPMTALHDHNERGKCLSLARRLAQGERIALICDAGTPLISDPGYHLVRAAQAAGVKVSPIPGPCAAVAALSAAGLPVERFYFYGFLPPRRAGRQTALRGLRGVAATLVFYEAGRRLGAALQDMHDILGGERQAALCRELTKLHESIVRAPLASLLAAARADNIDRRGEFVLLVAAERQARADMNEVAVGRLIDALMAELPAAKVAAVAAKTFGAPRQRVYEMVLARKKGNPA